MREPKVGDIYHVTGKLSRYYRRALVTKIRANFFHPEVTMVEFTYVDSKTELKSSVMDVDHFVKYYKWDGEDDLPV